jgi:drug/metabolite transporter (DMT)-like permease
MAASWGLVAVVNKWLLAYVHPLPLNFLVRVIAVAGLLLVTVPLTVFHLWPYGFGIDLESFLLIIASAAFTWLVGFTAYTCALRAGRVGIVTPLTCTDPLWTALFSLVLIGSALRLSTVAGMAVTFAGVILLSRWLGDSAAATGAPDEMAVAAESGPARAPGETGPGRGREATAVVGLALLAAAAWGLSPVLVQMAEEAYGAPSAFMMVESQLVGALALGAWIILRRRPLFTRRLDAPARRRVVLLLLASGALEVVFSLLFYLVIDELGAVLAMLLAATAPVFGVVAGMLLLKERLSVRLVLAIALTIGGVFVATAARLF